MEKVDLRRLPPVLRVLTTGFLVSLGLAYAVALLFVFVRSDMQPAGISAQYRGNSETQPGSPDPEPDSEAMADSEETVPAFKEEWKHRSAGMNFPKSLKDMILTTHLHMLSISVILFLLGGIFAFSSFPEKAKVYVIASGFTGLVLTYACMWALRYLSASFSSGVFLCGLIQAASITVQFAASLRDLVFGGGRGQPSA